MLNQSILRKHLKANWPFWLVIMILPPLFVDVVLIIMPQFDSPNVTSILDQMIFASLGFEMPLIYIVVVANRLVCGEVQSGAITYVVTSSLSRREIISTKIWFLVGCIFFGWLLTLITTYPVVAIEYKNIDLSYVTYFWKITGLYLLLFMVSGISFMASSIFNKSVLSFVVGAGVPILFFLLNVLSGIPHMEPLKYLSLNTLFTSANNNISVQHMLPNQIEINGQIQTYTPEQWLQMHPGWDYIGSLSSDPKDETKLNFVFRVTNGNAGKWVPQYIVMILIGVGLYVGSSFIFVKKDLPL